MDNIKWWEKSMCKIPDWYRQVEYCRVPLSEHLFLKDNEVDLKKTENQSLLAERIYLSSYIGIFCKRRIVLDETTVHD